MIKNLNDFVSHHKFGKAFEGVLVTPDTIVATDTFKLIEIKKYTGLEKSMVIELPEGVKTFNHIVASKTSVAISNVTKKGAIVKTTQTKEMESVDFPLYKQVIPQEDPEFTIMLSPAHLKEVATAFDSNKDLKVKLEFFGRNKAVKFTNEKQDVMVLLMPINS